MPFNTQISRSLEGSVSRVAHEVSLQALILPQPMQSEVTHIAEPAKQRDAATLYKELGAEDFDDREKAESELLELARHDLPAFRMVSRGLTDPDLEIVRRCERIYEKTCTEHDATISKEIIAGISAKLKPLGLKVNSLEQLFEISSPLMFKAVSPREAESFEAIMKDVNILDSLVVGPRENQVLLRQLKKETNDDLRALIVSTSPGTNLHEQKGSKYLLFLIDKHAQAAYGEKSQDYFGKDIDGKKETDRLLQAFIERPAVIDNPLGELHGYLRDAVNRSRILERDPDFRKKYLEKYN